MSGGGLEIPGPGSAPGEQAVTFAAELIDRSGKAPVIEAALAHRTGRPRPLPVRAVLTALLCLALDDRPLFLTEVTRLLFCQLPPAGRRLLGVPGTAATERAFKAAYRRVRYCFHAIVSVADPSALPKNRRLARSPASHRLCQWSHQRPDRHGRCPRAGHRPPRKHGSASMSRGPGKPDWLAPRAVPPARPRPGLPARHGLPR